MVLGPPGSSCIEGKRDAVPCYSCTRDTEQRMVLRPPGSSWVKRKGEGSSGSCGTNTELLLRWWRRSGESSAAFVAVIQCNTCHGREPSLPCIVELAKSKSPHLAEWRHQLITHHLPQWRSKVEELRAERNSTIISTRCCRTCERGQAAHQSQAGAVVVDGPSRRLAVQQRY